MKSRAQLRAVIVDDEKPARLHLAERLAAHPEISLVGEAESVADACRLLATLRPDVLFIDVRLRRGSGFDLLRYLDEIRPAPLIVFVTAHDHYAVRAFETNALDYLTKPVQPRRLAATVARLLAGGRSEPAAPALPAGPVRVGQRDLVMLRDKSAVRLVQAEQICAVLAEGDYTRALLSGDDKMLVRRTLVDWERQLPVPPFVRISRRLLINRERVKKLSSRPGGTADLELHGHPHTLALSQRESARLLHLRP